MKQVFQQILLSRQAFLRLIEPLSTEQLNKVPDGFNNNLVWNLGHLVVSTPALCYLRTGVNTSYAIPLLKQYIKGSRPEKYVEAADIALLKTELISSISLIEEDYANDVFKTMSPYATETYVQEMQTIEEVITCTLAHDNFHFGYAVALKRALLS